MASSQGAKANYNGSNLEDIVATALDNTGHSYMRQVQIGKGIHGEKLRADFVVDNELIIECKWQQVGGSADQKLTHLVVNIKERYPLPTIIVIDGKGFREGAIEWTRNSVDGRKLLHVMDLVEFVSTLNSGLVPA